MAPRKNKTAAAVVGSPGLLLALVKASLGGEVIYTTDADRAGIDPLHVEINRTMTNENGAFASRASAAGIAFVNAQTAPASGFTSGAPAGSQSAPAPASGTPVASKFKILDNVTLPAIKRGGRKSSEYNFDSLQKGQGFFVPASADMPNPAKSLASTVSSASARFATDIPGQFVTRNVTNEAGVKVATQFPAKKYERKFEIRSVEDGGVVSPEYKGMKGAIIARVV